VRGGAGGKRGGERGCGGGRKNPKPKAQPKLLLGCFGELRLDSLYSETEI